MDKVKKTQIKGDKVKRVSVIPDFSDHEDLSIIAEFKHWLLKERTQIEQSFRVTPSYESTCRLQGKALVIDQILNSFSTHKDDYDEKQQNRRQEYNEYDC